MIVVTLVYLFFLFFCFFFILDVLINSDVYTFRDEVFIEEEKGQRLKNWAELILGVLALLYLYMECLQFIFSYLFGF